MAGVFATQQTEMEDVIMQDASLLSDGSRGGTDDYNCVDDPMDISPAPIQQQTTSSSQYGLSSGSFNAHPPLSHVGISSFASHQPGPRAPQRFSPNSRLRTTTGLFGLSNQMNTWARPVTFHTQLPSTRDSSFTSLSTNHSTFDRKSFSFDSFTSAGTAEPLSRKRSIDQDVQAGGPTTEKDNRLSSKYRRVSSDKFPGSAILPDSLEAHSTEEAESRFARSTVPIVASPLRTGLSATIHTQSPAHVNIPGMWPEQSPASGNNHPITLMNPAEAAHMFGALTHPPVPNVADNDAHSVTETVTTYAGSHRTRLIPHHPARASPTRINLHALPVEQRRQIRDNQRRRERGSPTTEQLPFPDLTVEFPTFPIGGTSSSTEAGLSSSPSNSTSQHRGSASKFPEEVSPLRRQSRGISRRGVPKSDRHKLSHRREQKPHVLGPVISPNLKQQAQRAVMLQQATRFNKFDTSILEQPETVAAPSQPPKETPRPTSIKTEQKVRKRKKVQFNSPLTEIIPERGLVPEIAPFLYPSPDGKRTMQAPKPSDESAEQKENIPPSTGTKAETESDEVLSPDPWLRPDFLPLGRAVSAVRLFSAPKPLPPGRTESIYAKEWKKLEEEAKKEERPARIRPKGPAVLPLPGNWARRVADAMASPGNRKLATTLEGDPLTKKDLATCYTPMAWLNDEVINAYLALIVDYLRRTHGNYGRHDKPRFHAFNSFFFSNLRDKGYQGVRRWANRAKIGGEALLNVEMVFVPVHNSAHWTLIVVKPSERTIENFDSLGSLSPRHVNLIKEWLKNELGDKYIFPYCAGRSWRN
ncbi:hypothetical protein BDV59DRAFT_191978 [Aspergillus ambiguus]|uniref:SUMO protease ULP1 n=1 Tax=Aspergillus ambiguus TaxID=176160 RepID=UPI003CCDED51